MGKHIMQWRPRFARFGWLLLLLVIVLLAFGLRVRNLDVFSFWTDEGLTPLRSGYSVPEILSNEITIQEGRGKDTHPPLYYLLIHVSRRLFGETDFAYRYPSLLAGILLVPVIYLWGCRLKNRRLGFLAAVLTAVNPLQVWYAQEARMYTLFVLLGALTSYVLWQALTGSNLRRSFPLYLFLASLTIYTHYTAVFLIAAQSILWGWLLWRRGQQKLILGGTALMILAAIPLLPFTIPRLFTGAEANYYYVSPFIMLQDVVHAFSLGVTIDFKLVSTTLLDWGAFGLLILGFVAARTRLHRVFLFIYLFAVVLGLMAGSLVKPMYQGVRHIMLGSPAFILLLAWAMLWLLEKTLKAQRLTAVFWGSIAALGAITLVAGPTLSLNNLYTNPRYAKNDFKTLITYIEQQAGENDLILFNDAVLLPLYDHYRQRSDIAATALPTYPHPANDQTRAELEKLSHTYQRIWLITNPPADDRDADGLVKGWLTDQLTIVDDHSFWGRTVEVRVISFDTLPQTAADLPADGRSLTIQWPNLPPLRGARLLVSQPVNLPTLWFDIFWETGTQSDPDARLRFILRGPDDWEWSVSHSQPIPTAVSRKDAPFIRQTYFLSIPAGIPPGLYTLYAQPFPPNDDNLPEEAYPVLDIEMATSNSWPILNRPPLTTPGLAFQNGLTLLGIAFPDDEVRPGHNLPFTLYWEADEPLRTETLQYEIEVIAPDGSVFKQQNDSPGVSWIETWPVNTPIAGHSSLYFRPEASPGRYYLRWRLLDDNHVVGGRPLKRPWYSEYNTLGEIEIKSWPLVTTLPEKITPIQVDFGSDIQLGGYTYEQTRETLNVTLYWQATQVPSQAYFSFVHLIAEDETVVTQQAFVPVTGLRPTQTWRAGEILTDFYSLSLPADLPAGTYTINVGLFNPETEERPSVIYQGQPQTHNQFTLGTITLP